MRKVQIAFSLALVFAVTSVVQAAPAPFVGQRDTPEDGAVNLVYDPSDGSLWMTTPGNNVDGDPLGYTSWDLFSASGAFVVDNADSGWSGGGALFPIVKAEQMFRAVPAGTTEDLPHGVGVYPTGWTADQVMADLTVDGSITPRGFLIDAPNGGPFLVVVPEPSSILLVVFGLLGLVGLRRK